MNIRQVLKKCRRVFLEKNEGKLKERSKFLCKLWNNFRNILTFLRNFWDIFTKFHKSLENIYYINIVRMIFKKYRHYFEGTSRKLRKSFGRRKNVEVIAGKFQRNSRRILELKKCWKISKKFKKNKHLKTFGEILIKLNKFWNNSNKLKLNFKVQNMRIFKQEGKFISNLATFLYLCTWLGFYIKTSFLYYSCTAFNSYPTNDMQIIIKIVTDSVKSLFSGHLDM